MKQDKGFVALRTNLFNIFDETDERTIATKALNEFENNLTIMLYEVQGQADKILEIMRDKDASLE